MSNIDKLREATKSCEIKSFMKLLLECVMDGTIKKIEIDGTIYEIYADILETRE